MKSKCRKLCCPFKRVWCANNRKEEFLIIQGNARPHTARVAEDFINFNNLKIFGKCYPTMFMELRGAQTKNEAVNYINGHERQSRD